MSGCVCLFLCVSLWNNCLDVVWRNLDYRVFVNKLFKSIFNNIHWKEWFGLNLFYMIFIDYCSGGLVFQIFVKIHWKLRTKQMSLLFFKYICKKISYLYESLNLGTSRKCICGHFIACVHIYTSCMHVRARIFTKNFELVCYCLILSALGYNFIRMQFFIAEIFAQ